MSVETNEADKFRWLQKYRREDQSAIGRNIADGTVTLKRRESKFREELERHEFEYIVYKDFTYVLNEDSFHSNFFLCIMLIFFIKNIYCNMECKWTTLRGH